MFSIAESWTSLFADQGYHPAVGLRAIAMLWVFWFHAVTTACFDTLAIDESGFGPPGSSVGARLQAWWWPLGPSMAGDAGVDLFLVLSGFLLGGLLLRELSSDGQVHAVRFYVRRWFRIVPAYATTMVVQVLILANDRQPTACPALWWSNLMFMNNVWPVQNLYMGPACMVHTWSIAVEFQCYLITPPLMVLGHVISKRCALDSTSCYLVVLGVAWLGCVGLRALSWNPASHTSQPYTATALRCGPYFAGMALAVALRQQASEPWSFPGPRLRAAGAAASWFILLLMAAIGAEPSYFVQRTEPGVYYITNLVFLNQLHAAIGRPLLGLAVAYLLGMALSGHAACLAAFLSQRAWRPVAALSYSLYLLQYVGAEAWLPLSSAFIKPRIDVHDLSAKNIFLAAGISHAKFPVMLLATAPLALAQYLVVERPLQLYGRTVGTKLSEWSTRCCCATAEASSSNKGVLV